jgi:hypothetical protein
MIRAIAGDIVGSRLEGMPFVPDRFKLFPPQYVFTDDTIYLLALAGCLKCDTDFGAWPTTKCDLMNSPRCGLNFASQSIENDGYEQNVISSIIPSESSISFLENKVINI